MLRSLGRLLRPRPARARRAVDPQVAEALQLLEAGQLDEAEQRARSLAAARPADAEPLAVLGRIAVHRRRPDAALRHFARALELAPANASLHRGLAVAHVSRGQIGEAMACLRQAIALEPDEPTAYNNLGNCQRHMNELDAAAASYRRAIALDPKYMSAYGNLAAVLRQQRDFAAAIEVCRKALRVNPDALDVRFNLGAALRQTGAHEEALAELQRVAAERPDCPGVHPEIAAALGQLRRNEEAVAAYREAIARQQNPALAYNGLGTALLTQNDFDGALASFRKALAIQPDFARIHSNLLLTMNYQSGWKQKRLYQEALQFDTRQARRYMPRSPVCANFPDPDRILKVGYVSPDLREHSVARFTRRLLGAHNRERFAVYAYADLEKPDHFSRQFEAQVDHWVRTESMTDEELARRVREDGIDILVDLAGHTGDNRLLVFARKPAPVQVTWLGYPNTTGMRAMDYRLTDAVADPPGEVDNLYAEKLVRLEHGFLCYQPDDDAPAVAPPPCLAHGHVTLGSFNTFKKISDETVRLWSRVLSALPQARLLLKPSDSRTDAVAWKRLRQQFEQQGIGEDRLELVGWLPGPRDHLSLYARVDIALDTIPYNGTTTTCEALWMGVPVVCLRGDRHAGRVGASILHHAGMPEFIAGDGDEYVALVQALAADRERLADLRGGLRRQMLASPLMDLSAAVETLENAYRAMWIRWCDGRR